ncbi:hypothetical protein SG34_014805 [Thalassomonas viridans]|uniref:Uncharacterized protein n=1 Tax=Thalassomonas viridans TaxID=137584 RepID=A0AAE9ZA37_9GAMM|nr:hypothetical protein [Thalassomonas viridans]WDE08048.1 hypothetical protein SG34_014805 [Thalassomonas viridans]
MIKKKLAPRAFNREIYHDVPENVFYGTDDGDQDGSFGEFREFEYHYHNVEPGRRDNIHMISVVGGLYGLNLLPLWRPKKLTFFDINPAAVSYFHIIRNNWLNSDNQEHFLQKLTDADYPVENEQQAFIRENIRLKQMGALPRTRGSSKRSYQQSWKIALDNFQLTKDILTHTPTEIRTEPMESDSFSRYIRKQDNLWIYASNISQFHFFDLEFDNPANVVILQIIHPELPQLLDLAPMAGKAVKLHVEIPLSAEYINETEQV